jgi:hypothetical protein
MIFVLSTFSHEAGTRREYPIPECLISHELSTTSSVFAELLPKQPTKENGRRKQRRKNEKKRINYQRGI